MIARHTLEQFDEFLFFDMKEYDIEKIAGRRMVRRFGFCTISVVWVFYLRRLRI